MAVPLLDLSFQNPPLEESFVEKFREIIRSNRYILGPEVEKLEASCAELSGVAHGIGVSSGTDALLVALMALEIGRGDEVLCPTFTFFATAGCIARLGATPVFVDACPVCFNLDVADAQRKVTEKTRAIIPVHLFGQAADMDPVMRLAKDHNLFVIEDTAQAIGATYKDRSVGSFGNFGTFSFYPSKNLSGLGDGGMLVTDDQDLHDRAKVLRNHGMSPRYYHSFVGGNFRLDPLQAAMLSIKLPHIDEYAANRQANAAYYTNALRQIDGVRQASQGGCCGTTHAAVGPDRKLTLPVACRKNRHIWNQYTVRVHGKGKRDDLRDYLMANDIGCEIYYPVPMHHQTCFKNVAAPPCPKAEMLAKECLSIPIYPELSESQKDEVIGVIKSFLQG